MISKIGVARINDSCVPNLFCLKQAMTFLRGVCVSQPSESTSVNRYTNLIFQ